MGLFTPTMKWIYLTKLRYGIDFSRTVTLGRQYCEPSEWRKAAKQLKGTGGGVWTSCSARRIYRELLGMAGQ